MKHSTFGYLLIVLIFTAGGWAVLHFEQFLEMARAVNTLLK